MKLASLEAIARALNAANLTYVVVGGLAVVAHGYSRQTRAVDLVINLDPASVAAVLAPSPVQPDTPNHGAPDPMNK